MTESFEGKVAIVTGGGGGMGQATAIAFAEAGAQVIVAEVSEVAGRHTVESITAAGRTAAFVKTDVSSATSVEAMVATAFDLYGSLDCAVNMAAIEFETGPLAELAEDDFERMIDVNLKSVFLCMKYEIRAMQSTGKGGAIVNIGSTNSFRPQPNQPAYTASKFGVLGLTKQAAIDYARAGIRINMIAPGSIDTPMLRNAIERRHGDEADVMRRLSLIGRFGYPSEIAKAALWLCCDESSFTIGHALAVDGGYLAR
jgi:glucose 1-dehydrogenase